MLAIRAPRESELTRAMGFERFLGLLLRDERITDLRQRAYVLATVKHETAGTWRHDQMERYNGDPLEYFKRYDGRNGNTEPGDGFRFRGRGPSQLTGRDLYRRMGQALGIPLEVDPDLALGEKNAFDILIAGMDRGLFTGKKLADYINYGARDYIFARKVINGLDKAAVIAAYAGTYESLLRKIKAAA